MADDAPKIADFLNALEAAQQDGYTHKETKEAANGIDIETLKLAFDKVSEQDEKAELDVESELEALKKGFDFAVELVKTLKKQPGMTDKGVLYGYYKCERGEDVAQPQTRRLFDPVVSDIDVHHFPLPTSLGKRVC